MAFPNVHLFDIDNGDVFLQFEHYSFVDERTGREVEGQNMFLVFPWGRVKLKADGFKSAEILTMLLYMFQRGTPDNE